MNAVKKLMDLLLSLGLLLSRPGRAHSARTRRKGMFSWAIAPLETRLMLSGVVRAVGGVDFAFDNTRIRRIVVNGKNILPPGTGGIYLIGSTSGRDIPEDSYKSIGAINGRMAPAVGNQVGPKFQFKIDQIGPNTIKFTASVTANQDFRNMSLAFDLDKQAITRFRFPGTRLKFIGTGRTDGWHDAAQNDIGMKAKTTGSIWRFRDIPQHTSIKGGASQGTALTRNQNEMYSVGVEGPNVKIRVDVKSHEHVTEMALTNHSVVNAFGWNFGPLEKGETAKIEGVISVEPR